MRSLVEVLIPGYQPTINILVYKGFSDYGGNNPVTLRDIVLTCTVDAIRLLAVVMLLTAGAGPDTMIPALGGYVLAGVAMKMIFDGKMKVTG